MQYNPDMHHRRSIRLRDYDYSACGAYFVTVCAQNRECLFGAAVNGDMVLNDAGRMIETWWTKLPENFSNIALDEYVTMPNHFHGIVVLVGADPCVCPDAVGTDTRVCPINMGAHAGAPLQRIVQWFKTMTTNAYIRGVKQSNWPPFPGRLWQRNYYDRIIRNDAELARAREYIFNNPLKWEMDEENPANQAKR